MTEPTRKSPFKVWIVATALMALLIVAGVAYLVHTDSVPGPGSGRVEGHEPEAAPRSPSSGTIVTVGVVHPQKGMEYLIEQPGSVRAFESVDLYAKASGFLAVQKVDIGDRVTKEAGKEGEVLAVIAVPEIEKQLQHNKAALQQAKARITQMEARVTSAKADYDAAKAAVVQADATFRSAVAWVKYRNLAHKRIERLFASNSIEEKLVEESMERLEASKETENSAEAGKATSRATMAAMAAKIDQAEADVLGAKSEVDVAQADIEKTQVLVDYATIRAPFKGEITRRNYFPGDFIRSASEGGVQQPLLTVQRTDRFRVVVLIPDSAVPFLDKGDEATVRVDSLPGRTFPGKLARVSGSENPNTRLMHVEIDLENPTGEINDGMYGKVQIVLDRFPKLLSIPISSTIRTNHGHVAVYVVRDGHAHLTEVKLSKDNGSRVVVLSGLKADDLVVRSPGSAGLTEGAAVQAQVVDEPAPVATEEHH